MKVVDDDEAKRVPQVVAAAAGDDLRSHQPRRVVDAEVLLARGKLAHGSAYAGGVAFVLVLRLSNPAVVNARMRGKHSIDDGRPRHFQREHRRTEFPQEVMQGHLKRQRRLADARARSEQRHLAGNQPASPREPFPRPS